MRSSLAVHTVELPFSGIVIILSMLQPIICVTVVDTLAFLSLLAKGFVGYLIFIYRVYLVIMMRMRLIIHKFYGRDYPFGYGGVFK